MLKKLHVLWTSRPINYSATAIYNFLFYNSWILRMFQGTTRNMAFVRMPPARTLYWFLFPCVAQRSLLPAFDTSASEALCNGHLGKPPFQRCHILDGTSAIPLSSFSEPFMLRRWRLQKETPLYAEVEPCIPLALKLIHAQKHKSRLLATIWTALSETKFPICSARWGFVVPQNHAPQTTVFSHSSNFLWILGLHLISGDHNVNESGFITTRTIAKCPARFIRDAFHPRNCSATLSMAKAHPWWAYDDFENWCRALCIY